MSPTHFDAEDRALQKALNISDAPPPPPSSVHQFASTVLNQQEHTQPAFWSFHFPIAASSAAAIALFFSLQGEPSQPPLQAPIEWADLDIEESDTLIWREDALDASNHADDMDMDIEENLFADMEVSDALRSQYDAASPTSLDDLDDDALNRLDELLNSALKNKGG
jgi:hypothetical protein